MFEESRQQSTRPKQKPEFGMHYFPSTVKAPTSVILAFWRSLLTCAKALAGIPRVTSGHFRRVVRGGLEPD